MRLCLITVALLSITCGCSKKNELENGFSYKLLDFHQHTSFSDGRYSMDFLFEKCDSTGLAVWANSEHGGPSGYNGILSGADKNRFVSWHPDEITGDSDPHAPDSIIMWRWQTLSQHSFPYILERRVKHPTRTIFQGLEWNVPGHEHASMSIIGSQFSDTPHCDPISEFEYKFDFRDRDINGGIARGWTKSEKELQEKALEGIEWLVANYPDCSYVIPAHPERKSRWSIADFRRMNNIAPDICFGYEGAPGHQRSPDRGEYAPRNNTYGTHTYGGMGWMSARVGGVWDALLSEGRKWWLFSCSDFHRIDHDFLPGEYNRTYLAIPDDSENEKIVDYMRSGNCFVVIGDFISGLDFTAQNATMGQTGRYADSVTISINIVENELSALKLHHIDLIEGIVGPKAMEGSGDFEKDYVTTTAIRHRFDSSDWSNGYDGSINISFRYKPVAENTYIRLRGTHHDLNSPDETDHEGNPLPDSGINTHNKAINDQWFYSNPIFLTK